MHYLTQSYGQRQASIEAATAAFLMSGKKIDEIESKEYKPRPERIEPQLTQEEIELRDMADQIRTLTATMNKQDMGKQLGISQDRITKICKQFGINLRSGTGRNPKQSTTAPGRSWKC